MGILAYGKVHRLLWSHVLVERKQPFHEFTVEMSR